MASKNITVFAIICTVLVTAIICGVSRSNNTPTPARPAVNRDISVPYIGKIQVLNGCGKPGAANIIADSLRKKAFDVKNIGNAPTSNYEATMVISRTRDMMIAEQVAAALKTERCVLIRNEDPTYDVTVIVGHDFNERFK